MPRIACIQTDVVFADINANAQALIAKVKSLSYQSIDIYVFPEAYLTGYCVSSLDEARSIAVKTGKQPDPALAQIQAVCDEVNAIVIVGFAEIDDDNRVFNSVGIFEPGRDLRLYRKTHLPELGLDHFVTLGSQLEVFDTRVGTIGILICFDIRSPEATRSLALQGADVIVLPTNWPTGADIAADLYPLVRASENKLYYATCNRIGTENGFSFIGKSKVIDPFGKIIQAAEAQEVVLMADMDFELSREKRNITVPGKHETTVFQSRRPELYQELTKPRPIQVV